MTSDDPEEPGTSSSNEHSTTKIYDQYDLNGISPQDFELLLELAPADQKPEPLTCDAETSAHPRLTDGRSAVLSAIKHYVIGHEFNRDPSASHTTSQRRAFERNVYDYARAQGLGKKEALSEVHTARIICGAPQNDSDDSSFGPEVDDTSDILVGLATTTSSYEDLQKEGKKGVADNRSQIQPRAHGGRRRSQNASKTVGGDQNAAEIRNAIAGADQVGKGTSQAAHVDATRSQVREARRLTASVTVTESQSSRRKRKRSDIEAAGDTANQSSRGAKKSKHFQQLSKEHANTEQSQTSSDHDQGAMKVDNIHEKDAEKPPTSASATNTGKGIKRQAKMKRRREKRAIKSNASLPSATEKLEEGRTSVEDVKQLPLTKVVATNRMKSEPSPPAEKKKRNRRKSKDGDSESKVIAGASESTQERTANTTELGPNDPKSEHEPQENFLRANMRNPQECTATADTPRELADEKGKQCEFIEKLDALKRFSNEKQVQLYDDGKYDHADKQTKEELKDLKEEKTRMEETKVDNAKIDRFSREKETKSSRKDKVKKDPGLKVENSGGVDTSQGGEMKSAGTRTKRTKRDAEKQEVSHNTQVDFQ